MTIQITAPTAGTLQSLIARLEADNADLVRLNDDLKDEIEIANESHDRWVGVMHRTSTDIHDEQRHPGPQRFCTESPCPQMNELMNEALR